MPYISAIGDLNAIPVGRAPERRVRSIARRRQRIAGPGFASVEPRSRARVAEPCEVGPVGVEYLVRAARVTDIDRLVALSDDSVRIDRDQSPLGAADLIRQLVYLPQASIVVAESQRVVVGGAILALRPSVRAGGYVGTIDLLVVRSGARRRPDHRGAPRGGPPIGQQQGLHRRRGRPAERPSAPALGADGLRRGGSAHLSNRGRGGFRRASHHLNVPAELRVRAGRTQH